MTLIKCKECGKGVSNKSKFCIYCGSQLKQDSICHEYGEKNKELAIVALIVSAISLFVFPILGIIGIILGAIVVGTNKNTESWNKAIWKYENKALGFGRIALMLGIFDIFWILFHMMAA